MDIYSDLLRGLSADEQRKRRAFLNSFSTSGYLDISMMQNELWHRLSIRGRYVMSSMDPDGLEWLSKLRADREGADDLVSCEYGWGVENFASYMVPIIFYDGMEWIFKVQKPLYDGENDLEDLGYQPRLKFRESRLLYQRLRSIIGPIVPEIITSSEEARGEESPFWMSFIITNRIRGQNLTQLMKTLLLGSLGPQETRSAHEKVIRSLNDLASSTVKLQSDTSERAGNLILDTDTGKPEVHPDNRHYQLLPVHAYDDSDGSKLRASFQNYASSGETRGHAAKVSHRLLEHALSESGHGRQSFGLHVEISQVVVDDYTGNARGIFTNESLSYRPAPFAVFSYPDMVTRIPRHLRLFDLGPRETCIEGSCPMNTLGRTQCEVWSSWLATWRLCISHYCRSKRVLSLADITRSLSRPPIATLKCENGTNIGCHWDSLMLQHALLYTDDNKIFRFIREVAGRFERKCQQEAGIGPFEPDIDDPGLLLMHFDHLFFHKADQGLPIDFDPRTPVDRLFNFRRRPDADEEGLWQR